LVVPITAAVKSWVPPGAKVTEAGEMETLTPAKPTTTWAVAWLLGSLTEVAFTV